MINLIQKIAEISAQLENWWNHGAQKNPCIVASVLKENHEPIPDTDDLKKFWTDIDFVINRTLNTIESTNYYGQAIPFHYVDFGASAMPCALGAEPEFVNKETVWAHPNRDSIDDLMDISLDDNNFCYRTILEITKKSVQLSTDHHLVAPFALGGIGDNLAGLYGTENMLMDMKLQPAKVKHVMGRLKYIWIEAFECIQNIIQKAQNRGSIGWAGIWAPGTTFPIQEDFSYMISPTMFKEFCLPHIWDIIDILDYPFYHLDGGGAIPHLNELLKIEKLKVIQWQPGAGKERLFQWYDLIRHILEKGKSVQVYAQADEVDDLVKKVGARGLLIVCPNISIQEADWLMNRYGAI
ncbi:MAG: hypothetical protein MUC94_10080 [bacterium]|nr:hypothetical protein [bacterium]